MAVADLTVRVVSVQRGAVAPLGPQGVPSGFVKRPVLGPVQVERLGLEGDGVADLTVHGGPDKAVYAYPARHYEAWRRDFPEHGQTWSPGGVGENLTVDGADEADVRIGDVFINDAGLALQVTQPRQPCFKFALRFADERLPQAMLMSGRCGWYLRVLSSGAVAPGDVFTRAAHGEAEWTVARFQRRTTLERRLLTRDELDQLAAMATLSQVWRDWALARIAERASS